MDFSLNECGKTNANCITKFPELQCITNTTDNKNICFNVQSAAYQFL